ncbi:type II toxin-antitoxin system Phd/YefM family antitoxin [Candidatus Venteria ishoeyi]|uniref:type II toxin-antitoxin system Phd/YefM family antitoxin n=1 Tax=Candidatus Venteria ishoeyi TaxID=1899563 RepID=UPI0025A5FF52|nr:type II toxin-antitoxin system Phd/YefM family antitoxin [Candidatus Venteria ishoeyi]MDM8547745.1 type II toxin-antitoxin system Phd/YefM family antitoxin [Candidatus Venteria ishoeyi]
MQLTLPLTDIQTNPTLVVRRAADSHQPVVLTQAGEGVAVIQALEDYQRTEANIEFMRTIIQGLADIEAGREVSLAEARVRLGLN